MTPFELSKPGHWEAWTIAARHSEQRLDRDAFGLNFGDATQFAERVKAFSVALNWHASREIRFQNIWKHSDFQSATPVYAAASTADQLIFQLTLIY